MLVNATVEVPLAEADILRLPLADGGVGGATCGFAMRNVTDLGRCSPRPRGSSGPAAVAFLETGEPDGKVSGPAIASTSAASSR